MSNQFDGFSADTLAFYSEIVENNNKAWFEENKLRFKAIQKLAQAFVVAMGEALHALDDTIHFNTKLTGSGSIFRIYRDTRFSKDKTPYKTNLAMTWWAGENKKATMSSFYFSLSADGGYFGCGHYQFEKHVMEAYREAVANELRGAMLADAIADITGAGYELHGAKYKRVPRGYDKEHPYGELLKHKGIFVGGAEVDKELLTSAELIPACLKHARAMLPLHSWLTQIEH